MRPPRARRCPLLPPRRRLTWCASRQPSPHPARSPAPAPSRLRSAGWRGIVFVRMRATAAALADTLSAVQRAERRLSAAAASGAAAGPSASPPFAPTLLFLRHAFLVGSASGESSNLREKLARAPAGAHRLSDPGPAAPERTAGPLLPPTTNQHPLPSLNQTTAPRSSSTPSAAAAATSSSPRRCSRRGSTCPSAPSSPSLTSSRTTLRASSSAGAAQGTRARGPGRHTALCTARSGAEADQKRSRSGGQSSSCSDPRTLTPQSYPTSRGRRQRVRGARAQPHSPHDPRERARRVSAPTHVSPQPLPRRHGCMTNTPLPGSWRSTRLALPQPSAAAAPRGEDARRG